MKAMKKLNEKEIIRIFRQKKNLAEDVELFHLGKELCAANIDTLVESTDIPAKSNFVDILDNTSKGPGVQIFIGSRNYLFKHSGLSMVMAPYKNKEQKIIGAIGVVGPTRINYAKIVPLVDYTSKIIGRMLG